MTKVKKYPGQKNINGVYHKIINNIPKHDYYHELFAGSGAIAEILLPLVPRSVLFLLSDIDLKVVNDLKVKFASEKVFINQLDAIGHLKQATKKEYLVYAQKKDFFFIDPPYLHETRPNSTELYEHEMTDEQHKQMLLAVLQCKFDIMIIHPKCELYDTMLQDWRKITLKIRYHNKTSIECLYMNYPKPRTLQTYNFFGDDCWDRQANARKAHRWINKLKNTSPQERNFLINRINNAFKKA